MPCEDAPVCSECGRVLKTGFWGNFDNTSGAFIAPDAEPEHGEFGVQAIGSGCAKKRKIPTDWLEKFDMSESVTEE